MRIVKGAHLSIDRAVKAYAGARALDEVSITVEPGELLALLGPSGCGKTTLLKIIAGLIEPDEGQVYVDGRGIVGVPPDRRDMGMLFQNYALFPHIDVLGNVSFGLEMRRLPKAEIRRRAMGALARVRLDSFAARMPRELSGGQQQRVALARAIAYEPTILLLDEPLAALDKNLREGMQMELRALCRELELTTVLVTHDQEEAMTMADRVAVMRGGRLEQVGTPREVYERPVNHFVAGFIGTSNFLPVKVATVDGEMVAGTSADGVAMRAVGAPDASGCGLAAVRPENIVLSATPPASSVNAINGSIRQILFRGPNVVVVLTTTQDREIIVSTPVSAVPDGLREGMPAWASWQSRHALFLNKELEHS